MTAVTLFFAIAIAPNFSWGNACVLRANASPAPSERVLAIANFLYATYDLVPDNEIQRKDCFGATPKVQAAFLLVGQANFLNEFLEAFVRAERVEHRHRLEINDMLRVFRVDLLQ